MEVNQLIRQLVDFMFKAEVKTAKKADGTESEYYEIQSRKVSKRIVNPDGSVRYEEVVLPCVLMYPRIRTVMQSQEMFIRTSIRLLFIYLFLMK